MCDVLLDFPLTAKEENWCAEEEGQAEARSEAHSSGLDRGCKSDTRPCQVPEQR
jgi:hypothetical protein